MLNKKYSISTLLLLFLVTAGCKDNRVRFKLSFVTSMIKVPMESSKPVVTSDTAKISAAGGEYESFQVVISTDDSLTLTGVRWSFTGLQAKSGNIDKKNIHINPVGYVQTTTTSKYYPSERGWWPDPLLRIDSLSVPVNERQPLWVTVYVPNGTPMGTYSGSVRVSTENAGALSIPVELRVWGFDIPKRSSIKTLTWVGSMKKFGNNSREARKAMYELLLKHRLGPGGRVELDEDMLDFCIKRGMNAFILDNIPNLKRLKRDHYSQSYIDSLKTRLNKYVEIFGPKGWLDGMVYVYNYDEVDKPHWPVAKDMYKFVKRVSPDLKVIQCLNIPEGVKALAGYADTWDVYVAQYKESGVDNRVAAGDEAWLAVCCYPSVRPNFFLEYPAIDGRMLGWICDKTGVSGFEYWSPNHWKGNTFGPGLRGGWKANTFSNYSGDGYLTYPGSGIHPLSSIRLENLRDGFEDYEYLHLYRKLNGKPESIGRVVSYPTEFTSDPEVLYNVRSGIAKKIEQLLNDSTAISSAVN